MHNFQSNSKLRSYKGKDIQFHDKFIDNIKCQFIIAFTKSNVTQYIFSLVHCTDRLLVFMISPETLSDAETRFTWTTNTDKNGLFFASYLCCTLDAFWLDAAGWVSAEVFQVCAVVRSQKLLLELMNE